MKLTERQCWDVIRAMVSEKNKEYASFINGVVNNEALTRCVGYTKRCYLNKFGFETEGDFKYLLKKRNITPKKEWVDNLSSEDLLIFLDYRCRTMQDMYEEYKKYQKEIERDQDGNVKFEKGVKEILTTAKRSGLIAYNGNRLKATSRPEKQEGELKADKLGLTREELIEQALIQTMASIAYRYSKFTLIPIEKSVEYVTKVRTHNVNIKGFASGQINNIKPQMVFEYLQQNYDLAKLNDYFAESNRVIPKSKPTEQKTSTEPKIELVGFDEDKGPVFMKGEKFVDFIGNQIPPVKIVYDINKNLIKYEELETEEDIVSISKFIGLDVQGTPIFADENGYYSSTGERIDEDDLIIDNTQDDMFTR